MRALAVSIALSLMMPPALAASPQVEEAIKAFQSVESDATRMKTFCELMKIDEQNERRTSPSLEAKWINYSMSLERISKQLGNLLKTLIQHPTTAKHSTLH